MEKNQWQRGDADCDAESSAKEGERADSSAKELQHDPAYCFSPAKELKQC